MLRPKRSVKGDDEKELTTSRRGKRSSGGITRRVSAKPGHYRSSVKCNNAIKTKLDSNDQDNNKTGVVVTTHGTYGSVARKCVQSYIDHIPKPCYIVLIINVSDDPETEILERQLLEDKTADVVRLDEDNGGLTRTWNMGIEKCKSAGCGVVILSNHDLYVESSISHLVSAAKSCPKNSLYYFGPVTNNPGPSTGNRFQGSKHALNVDPHVLQNHNNRLINLNGFLMCFPMRILDINMFDSEHYFNPKLEYAGNETEWFDRFTAKGGLPILVPRTYVHHYKFASWRNQKPSRVLKPRTERGLTKRVASSSTSCIRGCSVGLVGRCSIGLVRSTTT